MILPAEIQQKARDAGVRDTQMEKDYILSWILQGVSNHDDLSKAFRRLKAVRFRRRFILKTIAFLKIPIKAMNDSPLSDEQIFEWFQEVFEYVQEEANIPLELIDDDDTKMVVSIFI
ncbi:MAG: hypothetical protein U5K71_15780 [Gracilimonas sp.]|nr:hypothetical protein [Gracilimonas sp.]